MNYILFFICFSASVIGAITGIGGGVIIKPVVDALKILPVAAISFLSGCTVLSMSAVSIIRSRGSGISLDKQRTPYLAIGAAIGGIIGKILFQSVRKAFNNDAVVLTAQSVVLIILTLAVLIFMLFKHRMKYYKIKSVTACFVTGAFLGIFSSFLGIGGGPINLMVLYLLFSMETKTATLNSLFIIFLSQVFSLFYSLVTATIPAFPAVALCAMIAGGVGGGLLGSAILKRISVKGVERIFVVLLGFITLICLYNIICI